MPGRQGAPFPSSRNTSEREVVRTSLKQPWLASVLHEASEFLSFLSPSSCHSSASPEGVTPDADRSCEVSLSVGRGLFSSVLLFRDPGWAADSGRPRTLLPGTFSLTGARTLLPVSRLAHLAPYICQHSLQAFLNSWARNNLYKSMTIN